MAKRNFLLAAVVCLGAAALSAPTPSRAAVDIDIDIAPPVARVEVAPPPRVGFVWAPGYWEWRGHAHVWVAGVWVAERHGWHWVPAHWVQNGPHWHFAHAHWER